MKAIIMPKFGFTQTEAEIVRWLKREGDVVEKGEPICEVTTDKVNMEVEAPESGTLAGLRFREGDVAPVTEVIAVILAPGEVLGESVSTAEKRSSGEEDANTPSKPSHLRTSAPSNATPVAQRIAQERGIDLAQVSGTGPGGKITREDVEAFAKAKAASPHRNRSDGPTRIAATPAARRIARELNVDLATVAGSGPRGRVQGSDVLEQGRKGERVKGRERVEASPAPSPLHPLPTSPLPLHPPAHVIPFGGMRKTIAARLQRSYQQAPHVTFAIDVDVTAAEALRARANARVRDGQAKVSLTAILAKACAWALKRHPMMNSRLDLDASQILLLDEVNIGIAVALDDGLIVPVVRDADRKGILQLANDINDLSVRARGNKLAPDDVTGGTFTLSNLGMFGIDRFTAIINPPETAILAVGRAKKTFVPDANDQPMVRPMMTLTLSADHRVVDGAIAARFMADLREALEHPEDILL